MTTPNQQYLTSFIQRATRALAELATQLAAALASGDTYATARLTHKGELLSQGLTSVSVTTNQLLEKERVYIAEKLLGLFPLPDQRVAVVAPPTLSLSMLAARLRGVPDTQPLTINGSIGGTLATGAQLVLSRDGREIARQAASVGRYLFVDATPGLRYQVELTGTNLLAQRSRPLVSPMLAGTGPAGASNAYLVTLPVVSPDATNSLHVTVTGQLNRILLAIPLSRGSITLLTQPDDENADITSAFSRRLVTLDFGADGTDQYEVLENYANFLGPFTLQASLQGTGTSSPIPVIPITTMTQLFESQFETQFE